MTLQITHVQYIIKKYLSLEDTITRVGVTFRVRVTKSTVAFLTLVASKKSNPLPKCECTG